HLRLESECCFTHRPFHCGRHRMHLRWCYFLRNTKTCAKCFVYFGRTEQLKAHLLASSMVDIKERSSGESGSVFKQPQRLSIFAKCCTKSRCLLSSELNHS